MALIYIVEDDENIREIETISEWVLFSITGEHVD